MFAERRSHLQHMREGPLSGSDPEEKNCVLITSAGHRTQHGHGREDGAQIAVAVVVPPAGPPAPPAPPPPPPPALPAIEQGPSRAAPLEHCYRCLQAAALRGCVELPFCTGYDANGIKCLRCRALHQACQSFPACALPEAQRVVAAQLAFEATHPRVADLALEAVTQAARDFNLKHVGQYVARASQILVSTNNNLVSNVSRASVLSCSLLRR